MTRDIILTLGLLLGAGLAARGLAQAMRVPEVLVLVAAGALLGPSALDVIDVPLDSLGAQLVFTLGVSAILFHGGLSLSLDVLRRVWISLGLLAVAGVVLTTAVVGAAAALAFGMPLEQGLLLGAVLSPTDPAILIPLFVGSRLPEKVAQAVVAESALNDPTGAVLALALAAAVLSGDPSLGEPVADFAGELALSTILGIVAGVVLSATISSHRAGIWRDSAPIAVLAVVAISYVSLDSAGGSGYLGAFLAGLVVGNMERLGLAMHSDHERDMRIFAATLANVVTAFVFLTAGASLPFGTMADQALPGLAVIAVLVLVARPLTVLACTAPDRGARWTRAELAFLAWTRETGVVPAALVGVLAGLGVPGVDVLASVVAIAIVTTLIAQAVPAPWLARRLGLLDAEPG
ncbi:MAG TPA: cation:proton antiporter [Solirubrobacteraceae bacterium]|nr:cation:proton antiporter [Solirubrobacteraceae bacterium]